MGDSAQPDGAPVTIEVLRDAAEEAGRAPSILNTQPWRWRVRNDRIDLYADRDRQVASIDAVGRLLLLSCGAGLHHLRVALSYRGIEPRVDRCPDPLNPDLLATVVPVRAREPSRQDVEEHRSLRRRRTERRLAPAIRVPDDALAAMQASADAEEARLLHLNSDQLAILAAAAKMAQETEAGDTTSVAEMRDWERRSRTSGQGVPPETVVADVDRPVPLRDLTSGGATLFHPGLGDDSFAEYLVLASEGDEPVNWLRAGEATSAVWLTATGCGLSASIISDVIEVAPARDLIRSLAGGRHPQLVMRVAVNAQPTPPPATPRRPAGEYIDVESSD